ncbi:MAG: S8 family peptidase [Candidatus Cloacimonetes bacterium]|nr:S8 family peptidase [Candidatus Cloacimonadota bacterium]
MKRKLLFIVLFIFAITCINASAKKELFKISQQNETNQLWENEIIPGEITIMFKDNAKKSEKEQLLLEMGCYISYTSPYLGFHKVIIPENSGVKEIVEIFNTFKIVKFAEPNVMAHAFWTPNDQFYSYQWHFDAQHLNMPAAWDIEQGGNSSVKVAVIDSGVAYENYTIPAHEQGEVYSPNGQYHQAPDLSGTNFTNGYDFVNNDNHANDENGHGTHCAGTIAQTTNNGTGVAGMAFNTTIMPIRVLDHSGSGSTQWIADGVAFAYQNGADILSMSLGGAPGDATGWEVVHTALINAVNSGSIPVIAAGNSGDGVLSYPAGYDECIAVASTDYDDDLAPYSQYGAGLDISAPGGNTNEDLNSDGYQDGVLQNTFSDAMSEPPHDVSSFDYLFFQGTSMATPHVAGLCALLVSHGITGFDNVTSAIYETATDLGSAGYDQTYGWGMINPVNALNWTGGGSTTLLDEGFESGSATGWLSIYLLMMIMMDMVGL